MQRQTFVHRVLVLIGVLALILAPGCATTRDDIAPATPLRHSGGGNANEVRAAVGPDGSHHILYEEEGKGSTSHLVYAYQKSSEVPILATIAPGADSSFFFNPDIAVTDDGHVYIAWHRRNLSDGEDYVCWATFSLPPAVVRTPTCNPVDTKPTDSREEPLLVVHENTVYIIYSYINGVSHNLAARRLDPLSQEYHDLYTAVDPVYYPDVAAAVADSDTLHAAFTASVNGSHRAMYVRYTAEEGFDDYPEFLAGDGEEIQGMSLDIDRNMDPNVVYYAFNTRVEDTGRASMHVYSRPDDATSPNPIHYTPLRGGDQWEIPGRPALSVISGTPWVYITGRNQNLAGAYDVWSLPGNTNGTASLINCTSSVLHESLPFVKTVVQVAAGNVPNRLEGPVIFFRQNDELGHYTDAFAYDNAKGQHRVRQIFAGSDRNIRSSMDLAVRGDHVLAVWIDAASIDNPRSVPWFSYNGEITLLPVILR